MPGMSDLTKTPRRDLHVFYVLDTSGSMEGAKISTLNRAMEETTEALKSLAHKNADASLKIAVMEFNSQCRWITEYGPENLEGDFVYESLAAGGLTEMGAALSELNSKLSRKGWLNSTTGSLMPVIIFMTDGYPTDNYMSALEDIRKNRWFRRGTKIGFALGNDADLSMIASVVGNKEAVIQTTDLDIFRRLMKFVSVTASMLNSQSATAETASSGADIVNRAKSTLDNPDSITPNIADGSYSKEPDLPASDDEWDDDEW